MAKRFGDDRSKDKDLNTEIDMEEMDNLDMEDPWGDGSGMNDAGGGRSPSTPTKKMVVEGVKGLAEGAMASVSEEVERNMPNLYTVKTEVTDTFDDLKELKDEVAKQLQPMMLSMENATRKILPRAEKFMPKKLYSKLKGVLDERAEARAGAIGRSKDEERADLIAAELSGVFGGGGEGTLELEKHKELEHNKERLMDKAVSSIQHRDLKHGLVRIYDSLRSTELFHRTLHTAYMKKSLELQYKHLFVAQDTHNLLARTFVAYEDYFKGIVKNTALPDVMKTQASDYIKKARTEKYGTMMSDFMTNARKMIFKKIKDSASNFLGNIGMIAQLGEMGADQLESLDDPMMAEAMGMPAGLKGLIIRKLAGWMGKGAAAGPVRTALQKISPLTTALNGDMENFKRRTYMNLAKLGNRWRSETGSWWKPLLGDYIPNISAATTASNDLLAKSDDAAAFDKLTRQSIVEIIPGYLGKIWHEIALLRNPLSEEQTFNMYTRGFTSVSQYQKDLLNDKQMFGTEDSQTEAVRDAVMVLNANNAKKDANAEKFAENLKPTLSRIIANHAVKVQFFNPQEIAEFVLAPHSKQTVYIKDIGEGCDPELFFKTCQAIVNGLKDKDGKFDPRYVKKFEDAILNVFDSTDNFKTRLATVLESWGSRRYLDGILVDRNNAINLDTVGRELSRFKIGETGESAWKRKGLDEWIEAKDKVSTEVAEAKRKFNESAVGKKLNAWRAEYTEWKQGKEEELPSIEGLTGTTSGEGGAPAEGEGGKPLTEEERKKQITERFKAGTKKKVGGWLSFLWNKAKSSLDKQLNKLPKNEEDVERQVEEIQTSLTAIYDSRPKSAAEVKQKVTAWVEKLEKDHPELAKKARQLLADANDSRIVIAAKAYGSYGKHRIEEGAEQVTKTRWWQFGKKKVTAAKTWATDEWKKFFKWAKKYSDERLLAIGLDRETLAKAYHGDEEAIEKVRVASNAIFTDLRENGPAKLKAKYEAAKSTIEKKLTEAKTATVNAATSAAHKLGEAHKATAEMGSKLASEYRAGAGIPEPSSTPPSEAPEAPKASSELMDLLTAWSQSHETNLKTLGEIVASIDDTLKAGLTVKGLKGGKGGGTIARVRNGFFGRGGRLIGNTIKGITGVGITIGKGIGKMYQGMGTLALGGAKAVVGAGKWMSNTIGLNPYVDVFVAGQEEKAPVLTWRKQAYGKGVVYADNGERVKQTKDIIKRGVPILDPETGNELITADMLQAGLWTKSGLWSGLGRAAVVGVKGFFGVEKTIFGGAFGIGKVVAQGLFGVGGGKEEPYVDVYRKGEVDGKPLLTRRQQKKGVFFASGERLERSSDIHEPIYDADKQILVSPEDIEHGLVDVNGKKLGKGQTSARQGLFGKAFDLGGTIAKGIFGPTGLKIAGTAIGAIGHVYKGLFDALLGGGKAVGRGFANIGARLFGFDSTNGFGRKAMDGVNNRLDTIIQLLKIIVNGRGGYSGSGVGGGGPGGGGGSPGGPGGGGPGSGASDPFFANKKSGRGRGRRGYWKEGKFIPDPAGDSYEKDGPDHPGGAAVIMSKGGANVSGGVKLKASDNYVKRNLMDPDGDGVEGTPDDDGFGFSDLLWWTLGEKALKKGYNIVRHPIQSAKAAWRWTSGKVANAGRAIYGAGKTGARVVGAGWKAARHGAGFKGTMKASAAAYRRAREASKAAKAVKAAKAARVARLATIRAAKAGKVAKTAATAAKAGKLAKTAKLLSKVPVIGKFAKPLVLAAKIAAPIAAAGGTAAAISGAGGGFAAGADAAAATAKAAEKTATTAGKSGSWFGKLFSKGGDKAAEGGTKAAAKVAEKAAEAAAATGETAAAASKTASVLGKTGKVLSKAAVPLEFLMAGSAATDAYKNADQILGKRRVTDGERDSVASQEALDTLGLGIGGWLSDKIYGEENAAAKAAAELDKELGIDGISIGTNISENVWGSANKWWNPLAYVTDVADGATRIADGTWKGVYRTTVGGAKAIWDNWGLEEREQKAQEEHKKFMEGIAKKRMSNADAVKQNVYSKLEGIQLPGSRDDLSTANQIIQDYRAVNKISGKEWEKMLGIAGMKRREIAKAAPWWDKPNIVTEIVNFCKKYYPPTEDHPKERFEFFKKLYKGDRNSVRKSVMKMFGIKTHGDIVAWDAAFKSLSEAAGGGGTESPEKKLEEASSKAPTAVADKIAPADGKMSPEEKLKLIQRLKGDPNRVNTDPKLLAALGITTPNDPDDWADAEKAAHEAIKSAKEAPKVAAAATAVEAAASKPAATATPVADKVKPAEEVAAAKPAEEKKEESIKPYMGGRRRTMTRKQVQSIIKRNQEVMKKMPPQLKKLIPELLDTLAPDNVDGVIYWNKEHKVNAKDLERSVNDLNVETMRDMPLAWAQNTKEKSLISSATAAEYVEHWCGKGLRSYDHSSAPLMLASFLVFGFDKWSPELDKMFVRRMKDCDEGSLTDQLWQAFHNGQHIAEAAKEDEASWPQSYKDAQAKWNKEWQERHDAMEKIDNAGSAEWKKVKDDYETKWQQFCESRGYDPNSDDDFDIGSMQKRQQLYKEFSAKYGTRPEYHEWLKQHPEFNSNEYGEAHPLADRPVLEDYEEMEAKKAEEARLTKALNPETAMPAIEGLKPLTPVFDPSTLTPMNKTNVVKPAEISLTRMESAKASARKEEASNVFEQYRKEQQELAAKQTQSLDQMNVALSQMTPFFTQFGSIVDKNGLKVAGIPELTAITAAKPAGGNTQVINNTIIQDQNDGLDLRKKQH